MRKERERESVCGWMIEGGRDIDGRGRGWDIEEGRDIDGER
mgnify:CR=1 FL=1